MSKSQSSRGTCVFCQNSYTGRGIARHLAACKARQAAIQEAKAGPERKFFHLAVKGTYETDYWLQLEIPAGATLYDLDGFLRDVWLECCGHLSMFEIEERRFQSMLFENAIFGMDDTDMGVELGQVLTPGLEFAHEYDFGSTTYLTLRVVSERVGRRKKGEVVRVMARNEPLDYRCEECGQPASVIDVFDEYTLLCDKCLERRERQEDGILPVVNSPRMGVCGYTGDAW